MQIWDLKYVSTSDDEDNDSDVRPTDSEESSSEEESSEDEQEEGHPLSENKRKNLFAKNAKGQGEEVPDIAK